jgi:hypothetical protein
MYTCSNPQLESKDYNKMNTNVDGDDGDDGDTSVGDGDDSHNPPWIPMAVKIGALLLVPSSRSLREARFLRVLVSTHVEYPIHLHGVKVFDQSVLMAHDKTGRCGRALAITMLVKASIAWFLAWFSPGCKNKYNYYFSGLQSTYFCP